MSDVNPQTATGDDLDWVAFCYVSNDLGVDDRVVFETRLTADTAACEAVCRAMQLIEATSVALTSTEAAETTTRHDPESAAQRTPRRSAIPVAVVVATVLVAVAPFLQNSGDPVVVETEPRDADAIVAMWTGSRDLMDNEPETSDERLETGLESVPDASRSVVAEEVVDVPAWLLVALQAEADGVTVLEN